MEDIIGILLYNSFIKQSESNQTFEEKSKDILNSPRPVKLGGKNMLHNASPART